MILELDHLAIGEDPGAALPPVSAVAAPGHPGVVAVETEAAPTVASLVAAGRMQADTGRLLVDGTDDVARIRRVTALVDTPSVAEPFPVMTVAQIVHEELAYAGERTARAARDTVVDAVGLTRYGDTPIQHVPTALRVRLLVELALLRPGIEALVVTSPERHGGSVAEWFAVLQEVAERGIAVLVVTSRAAAETIDALMAAVPVPDATSVPGGSAAAPDATSAPNAPVSARAEPSLQAGPPVPAAPSAPSAPSAPTAPTAPTAPQETQNS